MGVGDFIENGKIDFPQLPIVANTCLSFAKHLVQGAKLSSATDSSMTCPFCLKDRHRCRRVARDDQLPLPDVQRQRTRRRVQLVRQVRHGHRVRRLQDRKLRRVRLVRGQLHQGVG